MFVLVKEVIDKLRLEHSVYGEPELLLEKEINTG